MKKLLCFVLALAMIFGCISMVTFVQASGTEYAGTRVTLDTAGGDGNYVWFHGTKHGAVIDGDNATINVRVYNEHPTARMWVSVGVFTAEPWNQIVAAPAPSQEAIAGEWLELSVTFPASYLENETFGFNLYFTTYLFEAGASFIVEGNGGVSNNVGVSGNSTGTAVSIDETQMPGYVPTFSGARITLNSTAADNYVWFNTATKSATVEGNTATVKVRILNEGSRMWASIFACTRDPWVSITNSGGVVEAINGEWLELSVSFDASYLANETFAFYIYFTTYEFVAGSTFVVEGTIVDNIEVPTGSAVCLNAEDMPGYVAPETEAPATEAPVTEAPATPEPTPEVTPFPNYAGTKVTLDTAGSEGNYVYFHAANQGATIDGDNATITVRLYNQGSRMWVRLTAFTNDPWNQIASNGAVAEAINGEWLEMSVTVDKSYLENPTFGFYLDFTTYEFVAGSSFVVESNVNVSQNVQLAGQSAGSVSYLFTEEMPGYVAPTPTPEPTPEVTPFPDYAGTKVTLSAAGAANNFVYFHAANQGATIADGKATITVRIFNQGSRMWVNATAFTNEPWNPIANSGDVVEAINGEWITLSVTVDEAYVANATFGFYLNFTTYEFAADSAFVVESNVNVSQNVQFAGECTGTVSYLFENEMPVEVTPEPTPEPTPVPNGVKLSYNTIEGNVAQVEGSYITDATVTTEIFNTNDHEITVGVQLKNGWGDFAETYYVEVVIPAGYKKTVTLTATEAAADPTVINVRYTIVAGNDGDAIIVAVKNVGEGFYTNAWFMPTGSIANVAELPAYEEGTVNAILGATLQIGADLSVNYYASVEPKYVDMAQDLVLVVTRNNKTERIAAVPCADMLNTYTFLYSGINAQCMAENVSAALYCGDVLLAVYNDYSVKQYAINQYTNGANAVLDKLLNDMLVYGAEAQNYLGYKTDALATDGIDWIDNSLAYVAPNSPVKEVTGNDQVERVNTIGVNVSSVNKIYFKLSSLNVDEIKVYRNGELVEYTMEGRTVYTDAIYATEFDTVFTIELVKGGETISTVSYNVNAFINNMNAHTEVGAIVKALNNYGQSAVAYAG